MSNMSNAAFSKDPQFMKACEDAGIPATTRQASKYRRHVGLAFWTEKHPGVEYAGQDTHVNAKLRPESLEAQRCDGKPGKIVDYGPYSSTPNGSKYVRPTR